RPPPPHLRPLPPPPPPLPAPPPRPPPTLHRPTALPPAIYARPPATYSLPSATYPRPSATYSRPSATYSRPSATYSRHASVSTVGRIVALRPASCRPKCGGASTSLEVAAPVPNSHANHAADLHALLQTGWFDDCNGPSIPATTQDAVGCTHGSNSH